MKRFPNEGICFKIVFVGAVLNLPVTAINHKIPGGFGTRPYKFFLKAQGTQRFAEEKKNAPDKKSGAF